MKNVKGRVDKLEARQPVRDTPDIVIIYDPDDPTEPERSIAAHPGAVCALPEVKG